MVDKSQDASMIQSIMEGYDKLDTLFPALYSDIKKIAASHMRFEAKGHTLQPTAVVNETYLQLVRHPEARYLTRVHFLAVCALLIRRVLIDHARSKKRKKRQGSVTMLDINNLDLAARDVDIDLLLEIDQVLTKLDKINNRQARAVELKFFGGFSMNEIAEALGISLRSAESDWQVAREWLKKELQSAPIYKV